MCTTIDPAPQAGSQERSGLRQEVVKTRLTAAAETACCYASQIGNDARRAVELANDQAIVLAEDNRSDPTPGVWPLGAAGPERTCLERLPGRVSPDLDV